MRSLFLNVLFLFSLLLFYHSLSAQTGNASEDVPITSLGTIHNEGDIHVSNEYCLNENNELIVQTNIVLGGLTIQGTAPNYYGVIPSGYPDMYIEYTINGVVYPPIQVGTFDLIELANGYTAFSHITSSPTIDFSDECNIASFQSNYIFTTVKFRLVTPNGDGWVTYPACSYAQSWNMFSCNIYSHAPWCDSGDAGLGAPENPGEGCYDEWFAGGFSAYLYCDCEDDGPVGDEPVDGNVYFSRDDTNIENRDIKGMEVQVYPNPMHDNLTISAQGKRITKVEVFDATGKTMTMSNYPNSKVDLVDINTIDYQHGLYFVKITTNLGISIHKVLK